jgi:hypothetical protein
MNFYSKIAMLALMIFVWLNASNTKGSCDPYVGIAFEAEKSNVCFVNFMQVLYLKRKNPTCVL